VTGPSIQEAFDAQIVWSNQLGSPLYATLLDVASRDLANRGVVADVVCDFREDPMASALALRFMGGVHRLVLMGLATDLAGHYPSVGGIPQTSTLPDDFLGTVAAHIGYLKDALNTAPQTNEIGRCAALLPLLFSALDGRPYNIRLLEIGSAGGLNLLLDRYRYDFGSWTWGDGSSGAVIATEWEGAVPPVPKQLAITSRRGCDISPMDVADEQSRLRLLSFIWPDQVDRFKRTEEALAIARADVPVVDLESAGSWLSARLSEPVDRGTMTVVQHSVMWQYMPDAEKAAVMEVIAAAGERATADSPVAHTSFEWPPNGFTDVGHVARVTTWPGEVVRDVGAGQAHGSWIRWSG
jgi:hypothetical protein